MKNKVEPRIVEASAHLVIGTCVTAKAMKVIGASVDMDLTTNQTATPKELEGVTIVVTGPNAMELTHRIAQAVAAINDPNIDPEERRVLIEAIKAFQVKPEEGGE